MTKIKCKRVVARDKDNRITAIFGCDYIIVDEFSKQRQEYTLYIYNSNDDFIGNLFCYKYEYVE